MSGDHNILSPSDRERWIALIEGTGQPDIHYHPDYISLFSGHMGASGRLFVFQKCDEYMVFPYFVRDVDGSHGRFKDVTSPWYYGGPLFTEDSSMEFKIESMDRLKRYFLDEGYLSVFSRYHPYLRDQFGEYGGFKNERIGQVVRIDLSHSPEWLWENSFNKTCRKAIRKSRSLGIETITDLGIKPLDVFHKIYDRSMTRKRASPFYRFSYDFLKDFCETFRDQTVFFYEMLEGEIIAISLKMFMYGRIYGFLGARNDRSSNVTSSHGIILRSIEYGIEKGFNMLDLGGGPTGSGLMNFKMSFSKDVLELNGLKSVLSKRAYEEFCSSRGMSNKELLYEEAPYFPEYRTDTGIH